MGLYDFRSLILRIGLGIFFLYVGVLALLFQEDSFLTTRLIPNINTQIPLVIFGVLFLITSIMVFIGWFVKPISWAGAVLVLFLIINIIYQKKFDLYFISLITLLGALLHLAIEGCKGYSMDSALER